MRLAASGRGQTGERVLGSKRLWPTSPPGSRLISSLVARICDLDVVTVERRLTNHDSAGATVRYCAVDTAETPPTVPTLLTAVPQPEPVLLLDRRRSARRSRSSVG